VAAAPAAEDARGFQSAWREPPGSIAGADAVRVLVLSGYGLNCEAETAAGFRMTGARAEIVHTGALLEAGAAGLAGVHVLAFVGGFSFGDHIASGRVLANRMRARMAGALARYVDDGGLVIGICNGFQTITKLGLLPALDRAAGDPLAEQQVSIVDNDRLGYRDQWVRLAFDPNSPCVFTRGASGAVLEVPSRHGEGKIVAAPDVRARIEAEHLVPLRYADAGGAATDAWPDNPNGSEAGWAALCDRSGRVFGVMPHPEAFLHPESHPDFTTLRARGLAPHVGDGLGILASGVRAVLART
jgi:phosphoribosylformylglycinamidine synthase subunit PurQ / glutaminase